MRGILVWLLIGALLSSGAFVAWSGFAKPPPPLQAQQPPAVPAPPGAAPAAPPPPNYAFLRLPVDCKPGETCWILNYADLDPGPGVRDHACGPRSYDGHDGTDFAVRDEATMRAGVRVRAAAAGTVVNIRDGMADKVFVEADAEAIKGRDCGNGVVIDHGAGWRTAYCHMLQSSIVVKQGQQVGAGAHLGYVGMSGRAAFPHLHFAVLQDGKRLDPFLDPAVEPARCASDRKPAAASLWLPEVAGMLAYSPLDLLSIGASDAEPDMGAITRGERPPPTEIARAAPVMAAWVVLAGTEAGDRLTLRLTAPDGSTLAERVAVLERRRARETVYVGRKRRTAAWPAGLYSITAEIQRGDGAGAIRRTGATKVTVR